jgi:hypothetical protein
MNISNSLSASALRRASFGLAATFLLAISTGCATDIDDETSAPAKEETQVEVSSELRQDPGGGQCVDPPGMICRPSSDGKRCLCIYI